MSEEKIYNIVIEHLRNENRKNNLIEYSVLIGKEQIIIDEEFGGGYDIRLNLDDYISNSVTIVGRLKRNRMILGQGTIFATDYKIYKNVFFWKESSNKYRLEKKYLEDYKEIIGENCITIGYFQIANSIRVSSNITEKMRLVSMFYNLVNKFINYNFFIHFEPCGMCTVGEASLSKESLDIDEEVRACLGKVNSESIVSFKIAKKFGMTLMQGLYHDSTLGPVFFLK